MGKNPIISSALSQNEQYNGNRISVLLSPQLIKLLSEQLYQSPLKAIEELVVNSYDAFANKCCIFIPFNNYESQPYILIFDNGDGMNLDGLTDLWLVGRSKKRNEELERRKNRKQIGKFGIGKLATSTIANQLTYISKSEEGILGVSINFENFKEITPESPDKKKQNPSIDLPVYKIENWEEFIEDNNLSAMINAIGLKITDFGSDSWTLAIIEELKPKVEEIRQGILKWVLSTAMPLTSNFHLFLNNEEIVSSKIDFEKVVEFNIVDIPQERIAGLSEATGVTWEIKDNMIVSPLFPSGIKGDAFVTERSLYGQKSDDIQRSHGFFVKVLGRLVEIDDPLFGMTPVRYGTFNRFHCDIEANDLDSHLTASRDTIEESEIKIYFRKFLREIFQEADSRYAEYIKTIQQGETKEGEKEFVAPKLVEEPVADALLAQQYDSKGSEANDDWFYIDVPDGTDINKLVQQLYTKPRSKYSYLYRTDNKNSRIVKFDPVKSEFWINTDHEFVKEYVGDINSKRLLEDFVTFEMLLEVYLKESHISAELIGDILQRRDILFRSFPEDKSYSLQTISEQLRESASCYQDLEVNLIVAARALGFTATHISGTKEPDGLGRFIKYPGGVQKIILEAKSTIHDKKSPDDIDFATLRKHTDDYKAQGCLLVAPGYTGQDKTGSNISSIANEQRISCWTVNQLADIVENAESRHIGAKDIFEIVTNYFSPDEVKSKLDEILNEPRWSHEDLYQGILLALQDMEGSGTDAPRSVDMVIGYFYGKPKFKGIKYEDLNKAFNELVGASKGALIINQVDGSFILTTSIDELKRRVSDLSKMDTNGRKISNFRND